MAFRPGGHPQGPQDDGQPVHGRALRVSARVSRDPSALPAEADDDVRDIRSDEFGRVWVRTATGAGATEVQGNVAHDDPDAGNPVKTGGHANADPRAAVDEDDRVDHSSDLRGRQRVRVSGEQGGAGLDVEVGTAAQIGESGTLLGTKDPSVGEESDAAVETDSDGSVIGFLRGLVKMFRKSRRIGPIASDSNNDAVTTGAVVSLTLSTINVSAGDYVRVSVTTQMTMLFDADPSSTSGDIIHAETAESFEVPPGASTLRMIAVSADGRRSVSKHSP